MDPGFRRGDSRENRICRECPAFLSASSADGTRHLSRRSAPVPTAWNVHHLAMNAWLEYPFQHALLAGRDDRRLAFRRPACRAPGCPAAAGPRPPGRRRCRRVPACARTPAARSALLSRSIWAAVSLSICARMPGSMPAAPAFCSSATSPDDRATSFCASIRAGKGRRRAAVVGVERRLRLLGGAALLRARGARLGRPQAGVRRQGQRRVRHRQELVRRMLGHAQGRPDSAAAPA